MTPVQTSDDDDWINFLVPGVGVEYEYEYEDMIDCKG
jgi:hypothetical protein